MEPDLESMIENEGRHIKERNPMLQMGESNETLKIHNAWLNILLHAWLIL